MPQGREGRQPPRRRESDDHRETRERVERRERGEISAYLRELRDHTGMTQVQVAAAMGRLGAECGPQVISHWENERQLPSAANMLRLLVVYGVLSAESTHDETKRRTRFVELVRHAARAQHLGEPRRNNG